MKDEQKTRDELLEALRELRASDAQKRAILNGIPSNIAFVNQDLEVQWANKVALDSIGKTQKEVLERKCYALWADPEKPCENCPILKALSSGQSEQTIVHTPDGRFWQTNAEPVFDDQGTLLGVMDIATDITELKRIEKEQKKQQYFLQKAQEIGSIGTWELDIKKNELLWTDENYRIFGLPIGSKLTYETFLNCIHPEDREYVDTEWKAAFDKKPYDIEHRLLVDGETKWVREKAELEFDEKDECIRGIGFTQDITKRKLAEEKLLKNLRRWRQAEAVGRIGTWEFDIASGRIWGSISAFSIYGIPFDPSKNKGQLLPLDRVEACILDRERIHAALVDLLEKNKPYQHDYEILTEDKGEARIISSRAERIDDEHGNPVLVLGTIQDITARIQAEEEKSLLEEQLHQAMKMEAIGRLAGGVAHDFNNVLCAITGNANLVLEDLSTADPLREKIEEITKAADRATDLTRQLLAFSRKQVIEPKVIDLGQLVENLHSMLARLISEDIILRTVPRKHPGRVRVDPVQIEQIVLNLAINARDAMPDGGEMLIETADVMLDEDYCKHHAKATPGAYVMLGVSDTGCGMSDEVREKIFEPFFTTKQLGQGTGLGLATVFGIVEQNGGMIDVQSEPGKGTSFKVYFPLLLDKAETLTHPDAAKPGPIGGNEIILVVEDEEMVRTLAVKLLQRRGYKVLAGSSGADAIAVAAQHDGPIDLLLTDVIMPHMNGRELAKKFAELRPGIKVLYTSGYSQDVIAHQGVLDEDLQFIEKPYSPDSLAARVREVLDRD